MSSSRSGAAATFAVDLGEKSRELGAVALFGAGLFVLVATVTYHLGDPGASGSEPQLANLCGRVGRGVAGALLVPFGKAAYVVLAFLIQTSVLVFLRRRIGRPIQKAVGVVVLTLSVSIALALMRGAESASQSSPAGVGGAVGSFLAGRMVGTYGRVGTTLLLGLLLLVSFLLATDWMLYHAVRDLLAEPEGRGEGGRSRRARGVRGKVDSDGDPALDLSGAEDEGPSLGSTGKDDATQARRPSGTAVGRRRGEPVREAEEGDAEAERESATPPATRPLLIVEGRRDASAKTRTEPGKQARDGREPDAKDAREPKERETRDKETKDPDAKDVEPGAATGRTRERRGGKPAATDGSSKGSAESGSVAPSTYSFPSIDLFKLPRTVHDPASRSMLEASARSIEQRLQAFHIGARVVAATPGPAVTQYELELDEGIQMRRVGAFEPDLAAALKAISVRVVAPIPGKDTVGVEVPNTRREMVVLRELLDLQGVGPASQAIPIFLGMDVAGAPLVEDLARMPHLLIAGTTGSGKSVCISSILLSVLMTKTPEDVRLILIDPKMVELQQFKSIPHLLCPVVTNMKKAPGVLEWCVEKMEERYELFVKAGVNHISLYNQLGEKQLKQRMADAFFPGTTPVKMPYVVLIIDELADLMAVAQQEVEGSIQRLAQKSRAVGIHVILATQSPRRDVVTGIIKANLPCKIGFKVSSKLDSRVILDANGAEKLLGHGDLLYVPPGTHRLVRAQGTYVTEEEIRGVVEHLEKTCSPARYAPELLSPTRRAEKRPEEEDELYEEAVKVVLGSQRGSATLLQRALNVGYTRASRLLELMEEDGLVGPFVGSKSREVYMTLEAWQAEHSAGKAGSGAAVPPSGGTGSTSVAPGTGAPPWEASSESSADSESDSEEGAPGTEP